MASAATVLANYESARDSIVASLATLTNDYSIRGRRRIRSYEKRLELIEAQIDKYRTLANKEARGVFRIARFDRAGS